MKDTIIFDLGGVLIDWNPRYVYRTIFRTEDAVDHFLARVCTNKWNEKQDEGRFFDEATEWLLGHYPEYETEIRSYYGRWTEMLGDAIMDTVGVLEKLRNSGNYRLYALTNWSDESFPVALQRFNFLSWFDDILVSGREKLIKPDPAIYELLVSRNRINKPGAIFIDDNPANVEGARSTGIDAIHFTSPVHLPAQLAEFGILV